jgi:hypothetical protein
MLYGDRAKLIQIKSEALLPHPPFTKGRDIGESFAQQLLLYRQIKQQAHC